MWIVSVFNNDLPTQKQLISSGPMRVCLDQISLVVPGGFFLSASILAAKSGKCVLSPGLEQIIVENRKCFCLKMQKLNNISIAHLWQLSQVPHPMADIIPPIVEVC